MTATATLELALTEPINIADLIADNLIAEQDRSDA